MIEKGDRVRVHADGDVIHVDRPGQLRGYLGGGDDRPPPRFRVALLLRDDDSDKARGKTRERWQDERTAWFYDDEVEPTHDKPLVAGNGWRDVCADMIREGKDIDAASTLYANSPDAAPYIRLLEQLEAAFSKLPTAIAFRDAWASSPLRGDIPEQYIDAYEEASDAFMELRAFRKDK